MLVATGTIRDADPELSPEGRCCGYLRGTFISCPKGYNLPVGNKKKKQKLQNAEIDGLLIIKLNYLMIKGLHLKTLPAVFMLVLFVVVSVFGSEGTLLCFGKDGHMAIEFVDVHNGSGCGAQLAEMENDACGPCKDVQFLSSPAYTSKTLHNLQPLPLISSPSMLLSLPSNEYLSNDINSPQNSHHKTLASLHSVVLLI